MAEELKMDRNLALEAVRVTEAAALSASRLMGRGDEKAADQAAVDAMRQALNSLAIDGTVVIGEGERDEAPMLYIGEKVGTGQGPKIDIALDPLEGTTITAKGGANALAVHRDGRRTAASSTRPTSTWTRSRSAAACRTASSISTRRRPTTSTNLAQAKKVEVADLVVCILDRPRHAELIAKVREAGARIMLIGDGDVSRRHRHLRPGDRHRHLHGLGRRAGRRAGGGGAALHRRPDAGPAAVPQRRRARPRPAARASPTSTANTACSTWRTGDVMFAATGVTDGTHAERRAPLPRRRRRRIRSSCARRPARCATSRPSTISRASSPSRPSPADSSRRFYVDAHRVDSRASGNPGHKRCAGPWTAASRG